MIFRYWGDQHADVQQFAPLVDTRAGGIRSDHLVAAIRARGWRADTSEGSMAVLRDHLLARHPVMLLVEDRPGRYHFIVAVGLTDDDVIVHDPTWGPNRRIDRARLGRAWVAAQSWMLVITPPTGGPPHRPPTIAAPSSAAKAPAAASLCDRKLDAALDAIEAGGLEVADAALGDVRRQCPESAGPLRELSGVRLAQSRWADAASLSRSALRLDVTDAYAWDVLGASLFVQNRVTEALDAWNHVLKPQLDLVEISGLTRTRHSLVAGYLGLTPNTLLTRRAFSLAERRLALLPDRVNSRLSLLPAADGFARVSATLQETSRRPAGAIEWAAVGVQTIIDRQASVAIAGGSGQGEVWSGSWRWWENRPRVAFGFAAPVAGTLRGVWSVNTAWERQTYAQRPELPARVEDRRGGVMSLRNWLMPALGYEVRAGVDVWNRANRTLTAGATLETRLFNDRVSVIATYDRWQSVNGGVDFAAASTIATFQSSTRTEGLVATARVRVERASTLAPLALWSGAGEGRARPAVLRAHLLLRDGIVDGPIFGRTSASTNLELQRWFTVPYASLALAGFTDIAAARHRLDAAPGRAVHADVGGGARVRIPGRPGTFRLDYARGLADNSNRIATGWNIDW